MEFERASLEIDGGVAILHMNDPKVSTRLSADDAQGHDRARSMPSPASDRDRAASCSPERAARSRPAPTCRAAAAT